MSFGLKTDGTLWSWGYNENGILGLNQTASYPGTKRYSSPVQIPGTTWNGISSNSVTAVATKTDGTLWVWGKNSYQALGLNQSSANVRYSSPVQVPGTTWTSANNCSGVVKAFKTDGTLWGWGNNGYGQLGNNNDTPQQSPIQIPGNWSIAQGSYGIKTDGTLWASGWNHQGRLGQNESPSERGGYSSPVQIPGTTWTSLVDMGYNAYATKSLS